MGSSSLSKKRDKKDKKKKTTREGSWNGFEVEKSGSKETRKMEKILEKAKKGARKKADSSSFAITQTQGSMKGRAAESEAYGEAISGFRPKSDWKVFCLSILHESYC